MNPLNIQSGWWVSTDERFVRCYNTREEAISHVKYQQDVMHSTANWRVQHIKITFEEQESHAYNYRKDKKWIKFCREHNFHPHKDYNTKIYDLYLRLCAEGIIN